MWVRWGLFLALSLIEWIQSFFGDKILSNSYWCNYKYIIILGGVPFKYIYQYYIMIEVCVDLDIYMCMCVILIWVIIGTYWVIIHLLSLAVLALCTWALLGRTPCPVTLTSSYTAACSRGCSAILTCPRVRTLRAMGLPKGFARFFWHIYLLVSLVQERMSQGLMLLCLIQDTDDFTGLFLSTWDQALMGCC